MVEARRWWKAIGSILIDAKQSCSRADTSGLDARVSAKLAHLAKLDAQIKARQDSLAALATVEKSVLANIWQLSKRQAMLEVRAEAHSIPI